MENENKTTIVTETTSCQNIIEELGEDKDDNEVGFSSDYNGGQESEISSKNHLNEYLK